MVNVPSDDIVLSTFKRITVWKLANFYWSNNIRNCLNKTLFNNLIFHINDQIKKLT